ncbi:MAG TPA: ATP-binding protein [Thermoanaerobaculia bacterium]|nr:ATP-binding protein [Thermoanaerobaculia bacterium]
MGLATHFSFWAPPDPTSARIGRAGERLAAQVRLACGLVGSLVPAGLILAGDPRPDTWMGLAYTILMILLGLGVLAVLRRPEPPRWLGAFTCFMDVSLVTALHLALFLGGATPQTVLGSVSGFSLYFLSLAFTSVRQDTRLCLLGGLTALAEYGVLVTWFGELNVAHQITRLLFLAAATGISIAIVNQSRGYLRELSRLVDERTRDLQQEKARAEAASQAKGEFLANMSHEIRTPLNTVLGLTSLVLRSPLAPEQKEQLQLVQQSGEALLAVISDVLDVSKIEAGRLDLELTPFPVRTCVQEALTLVAHKAAGKRLPVHCRVGDEVPAAVESDASRLRQILVNLLDNAVKFTERGEVRLEVAASPADGGRVELQFTVRDTGIGIAAEALERLFKPFVQGDSSMSRRYGGTGLGLAISRRLAERLGGRLWVESEPGRGSAFSFTIRCRPTARVDPPAEETADLIDVARHPWNILVAEDNLLNQKVVALMLESLGYRADVAGDGFAVLEALRRRSYDLILMDVQMPGMDGLEATRRLRAELPAERQPRVIALTANVLAEQRVACLEAGMDDFLGKPLSFAELRAALLLGERTSEPPAAPAPAEEEEGLFDPSPLDDLARLEAASGKPLVRLVVETFLAETPQRLERLREALGQSDARELAFVAHSLKGSCGQVGALRLAALSAELENAGRQGSLETAPALLARLDRELGRVAGVLEGRGRAVPR